MQRKQTFMERFLADRWYQLDASLGGRHAARDAWSARRARPSRSRQDDAAAPQEDAARHRSRSHVVATAAAGPGRPQHRQYFGGPVELCRFITGSRLDNELETKPMNGIIYLIGLIVVIMAILSFFGLR
jgi:hypothetical protein